MEILQSQFNFNVSFSKQLDTEKREIEGIASSTATDRDGQYFPKELLERATEEYVKIGTLLYEHGHDPIYARRPIGKINEARVDEQGRMIVKGVVSDDFIWEKIKLGELQAFSIGGLASWETRMIDGKSIGVATQLDIAEISIVSVPANKEAIFSIAKSLEKSYLSSLDSLEEQKMYNKSIINQPIMEEMIKNIKEKIDGLVSVDAEKQELKKSLEAMETEKGEIAKHAEELEMKVAELEKSLVEAESKNAEMQSTLKSIDEKLVELVQVKKKAKTDEEVEKSTQPEEVINLAEESEKIYNAIFKR